MKLVLKILIAACCAVLPLSSRADTVVSNLTFETMTAALTNGGLITFTNVATNATLILTTNSLVVSNDAVIDGSGFGIAFSGNTSTNTNAPHARVFLVTNNASLTLANLSIVNGQETNGAGIFVSPGSQVTLTNCTLSGNVAFGPNGRNGNNATSNGGDGGNGVAGTNGIGGAIYNLGTVTIQNSLISSNTATGGDGGMGGRGGNDSSFGGEGGNGGAGGLAWGGGIYNGAGATLFIINSTLTNNYAFGGFGGIAGLGGTAPFPGEPGRGGTGATGLGGGIYNLGEVTITNSTLVINAAIGGDSQHAGVDEDGLPGGAASGGAIFNSGILSVGNSTITENFAEGGKGGDVFSGNFVEGGNGGSGRGGAIFSSNIVTLVSSTLATNDAFGGPGGINPIGSNNGSKGASLGGNVYRLSGSVTMCNTILAKGSSGANYASAIAGNVLGRTNLSSDATPANFPAAEKNQNAWLASLANNGGPTATMALRTNSPAIDKADPNFSDAADQRGVLRPQGHGFDIGAFELVPTFSISGFIWEITTTGTNGVSNIVVTAGEQTATSQANGAYLITDLIASNYVVTPTAVGAGFTPVSTNVLVGTNFANPSGNETNINFFANPATVTFSFNFLSGDRNLSNAVFSLQFPAMPERDYVVQTSTNLSQSNGWQNIFTNRLVTNELFQFSQTNLSTNAQRFFRVLAP